MSARQVVRRRRILPFAVAVAVAFATAVSLVLLAVPPGPALGSPSGWTGPTQISGADDCTAVSMAVDAEGATHVAASCDNSVSYITNARGLGQWVSTRFSHPADRADLNPKITIDGDTIYVAYTRAMPGDDGPKSVGIYVRQHSLMGDTWSTATRLGPSSDLLGDFDVVHGVIHATVTSKSGTVYYETLRGGSLTRYALPGATTAGAFHVESDHAPRIVYETDAGLRYAVFHGNGFDWWSIPGTSADSRDPEIAMDADNKAHIIWAQPYPVPESFAGTFYTTNRTGAWSMMGSGRVTATTGPSALEVDLDTGRLHVVVATSTAVKYYTPVSATAWGGLTIDPVAASDVDVALDLDTGRIAVVSARLNANLVVQTKP